MRRQIFPFDVRLFGECLYHHTHTRMNCYFRINNYYFSSFISIKNVKTTCDKLSENSG